MGLLRFLLALAVVTGHCENVLGLKFMNGQIAVQSFYIISGFYMSLILNEKYINQPNAYSLFLTNRLLRLFPIYWTVLLATLLFSLTFALLSHSHSGLALDVYSTVHFNPFSLVFLLLTNLLVLGQDLVMFMGINPQNGNLFFTPDFWATNPPLYCFLLVPQAWTLGLELLFYFVAPFLVRRRYYTVLLVVTLSLFVRLFLHKQLGFTNDPWTYRFFPSELMFFLFGTIAYKLFIQLRHRPIRKPIQITILVIVILLTLLYPYIPSSRLGYFPVSIKGVVYLLLVTCTIPFLFIFTNKLRFDNQIGELSYPIYISHILVILFIHKLSIPVLNQGWIIVLVSILVAYLLNRFVALPIEKIRQSRVARASRLPGKRELLSEK